MTRSVPRIRLSLEHRIGVAVVAGFVGWILLSGLVNGRSPWGMVSVILLATVSYALGHSTRARLGRLVAPLVVVGLGLLVLIATLPHPVFSLSTTGFLGYSNANGAFFVLAAFAALMALAADRSAKVAPVLPAALVLFLVLPVLFHARGAALSSLLVLPALWIVVRRRGHRMVLALAGVVVIAAVALSFLVARHYTTQLVARRDYRSAAGLYGRANLWADGYRLFADHSLIGVGPGGFQETSFYGSDPDGRWAHNEFLQMAVETGFPGLCFLLALVAWSILVLARPPTDVSTIAALGVAAIAVDATTDHLFHFPVLPALVALLVGRAVPGRRSKGGKRTR